MSTSHGLVDLILPPGVDDGSSRLEESLAHARRLVAAGLTEAAVTPHVGHPTFPVAVAGVPGRT